MTVECTKNRAHLGLIYSIQHPTFEVTQPNHTRLMMGENCKSSVSQIVDKFIRQIERSRWLFCIIHIDSQH